jgi:hypothetical protein
MYNRRMRESWPWILVGGILLILAVTAALLLQSIQRATQPVASLSNSMATEVANVLHPTATIRPDPVTIVREVRSLARLETIQYSVEKVITAESGQGPFGFLFGDRLLLVAHGTVIAGVDLGMLAPEDVQVDDAGRVYIDLPEAEVLVATLDNDQSYVYDRDTGLLTKGNLDLETAARRAAEAEIEAAALQDGILAQAQTNAEDFLYRFLRSLDYPDVLFTSPGGASVPAGATASQPPTPTP